MLRVGVLGAGGRMGREVCRAIADEPDLELVAAVDPALAGIDLRQVTGIDAAGLQVASDVDELERSGAQVAVDFTVADAAVEHMRWCASHGVHAVVGTTGIGDDVLGELRTLFETSAANCVMAANFAIGAVLMIRFAELAAPFMDGVEIVELHHDGKLDAPSGTLTLIIVSLVCPMAPASTPLNFTRVIRCRPVPVMVTGVPGVMWYGSGA